MMRSCASAKKGARADAERADRREVAERIRTALDRSGLTRTDFAELVGTSPSRLSTYLSGKVTPSAATLLRIERPSDCAVPVDVAQLVPQA